MQPVTLVIDTSDHDQALLDAYSKAVIHAVDD
jgi:hypothetical protein